MVRVSVCARAEIEKQTVQQSAKAFRGKLFIGCMTWDITRMLAHGTHFRVKEMSELCDVIARAMANATEVGNPPAGYL